MTINRHNYEVFLVDYLDGKLKPSLVGELLMFFELNPDLKNEFEGLEDAVLVGETIAYPHKSDLKKKSFLKNGIETEVDYLCIASIEGVLTDEERARLDAELNENDDRRAELKFYQKTIIQPSPPIIFPNKSRLKRATIIPMRYSTLRRTVGIAASIGLILGIYTVGKMIVNNNRINEYSKSDIIASENHPVNATPKEIIPVEKSTIVNSSFEYQGKAKTTAEPVKLDTVSKNEVIRKDEFVPNKIMSIASKEIVIKKDPQYEQFALFIETYPRYKDFSNAETNSYSENTIARSNVREIGVFEIIQYGIQSFGKFIGKDIRLNANKDKNGKIEKISFESNLIAFSAPIRKKE